MAQIVIFVVNDVTLALASKTIAFLIKSAFYSFPLLEHIIITI